MTKAIYPGSFDPVTLGHLDIIVRASKIFDELTILVVENKNKTPLFLLENRVKMISDCIRDINNIKVDVCTDLTVEYAASNNINIIIRGIRDNLDFEYERRLAHNNKMIDDKIETIFINANSKYLSLSSSAIKELLAYKKDVSDFVPKQTLKYYKDLYV